MATWRISTTQKKCVEEHTIWVKDSVKIVYIEGFLTGAWTVETEDEEPPTFDLVACPFGSDDEDSIDMMDNGFETEVEAIEDSWFGAWEFPADFDPTEAEAIEKGWVENSFTFMEKMGWHCLETQQWAWGEFDIERID